METYLLFKTVTEFNNKILNDGVLTQTLQNANQQLATTVNNPNIINQHLNIIGNAISDKSKKVNISTKEEYEILNIYNFSPFYSNTALDRLAQIKSYPQFSTYFQEFQQAKAKAQQIIEILSPLPNYLDTISNDMGVIEIVFEEGVAIDEITQFKKQSADWNLILGGYAAFVDIRPEDFVISSIDKHSPAKVKIMTTMAVITFILATTKSIVDIEKAIYPDKNTIENLKKMDVGEIKTELIIKQLEKHLDDKLEKYIDSVINKKIEEKGFVKEDSHEKITSLNSSIAKQRDFINNGGTINFYVNAANQEATQNVLDYNKSRHEVKNLKDSAITKQISGTSQFGEPKAE